MPIQDKPRLWVIEMLPAKCKNWEATVPAYVSWKKMWKEYSQLAKLKSDTQYRWKRYEAIAESSSPREGKE